MTASQSVTGNEATSSHSITNDAQLIQGCLQGNEASWSALLAKYKNLIFSIPIKYGFSREDAADIFQSVCLDVLHDLSSLRDSQALAGWLIRVTHNKCFHHLKQSRRFVASETSPFELAVSATEIPENKVRELQQEQVLRDAIGSLNTRCRLLVQILFFESPARPYKDVAKSLGLATGSIGFIRARCLSKLGEKLREMGFGEKAG
jgi:RNA polymerase sigma factor (sigma-70 family)